MIHSLLRKHLAGWSGKRVLDVGPGYSDYAKKVLFRLIPHIW